MNSTIPIVWIETGRPLPQFARNNFKLTTRMHPHLRQMVLSENNPKIEGVEWLNRKEIVKSEYTSQFEVIRKDWSWKQETFWLGTTSRFFYLYDLMKHKQLQAAIHLESDCILLDSSFANKSLNSISKGLAYPMQADGIGCASVFRVEQLDTLKRLLEYILVHWPTKDIDDMTLLGQFERELLESLPTYPPKCARGKTYIFDALSIGQYYMGTDARNCRLPFARRGLIDDRSGSNSRELSKLNWEISKSRSRLRVHTFINSSSCELVNIHIRSKKISPFPFIMFVRLKRAFRVKHGFMWSLGTFDPIVFVERIVSFINRRIIHANVSFEKRFR